jgi:3'-phosphoadenosine 5'-phosphosulfate sulfotransferase (PAPS reductase)/FAD synthetase
VVWISAGAASAVAGKLTLGEHPDAALAYTDPGSEHPDNARFLDDLERWYDRPIVRLRSDRYVDTWQVWTERRFLVGPSGALCTTELKKRPRFAFERPDDVQVFGYTSEEQHRADRFRQQNPEVTLRTPLIERGLTKDDCLAIIDRSGIAMPAMYLLGYRNNNCIGCPKGGIGYWNKIRVDFPGVFDRMARLERELDHTVLREEVGVRWADRTDEYGETYRVQTRGTSAPLFLDELDPERGNHVTESDFECSLLCAIAEAEMS